MHGGKLFNVRYSGVQGAGFYPTRAPSKFSPELAQLGCGQPAQAVKVSRRARLAPAKVKRPPAVSKAWAEAAASLPLEGLQGGGRERQGTREGGPCPGSKRHGLFLLVHRLVIDWAALFGALICMGSLPVFPLVGACTKLRIFWGIVAQREAQTTQRTQTPALLQQWG
jgi:hypothetical protein